MRDTKVNSMIVQEDNEILVIHKPAGIATETARLGQADVVSELKNYRHQKGEGTYLGVIHRLDQPVEGLLVFAKNPAAAAVLSQQLQKGMLKKSYHALLALQTDSHKDCEGAELIDYLLKDKRTNLSRVVTKQTEGAKQARLTWKRLNTFSTQFGFYALAEIEISTGRHHQIRVQMAHAGMPLLGDSKYGSDISKKLSAELGLSNTALFANQLEFMHPQTGKKISITLPYPKNWNL